MKATQKVKTKSGVTALYVVIFASLLFTIITVGFVNLVLSEVYMTTNDELSQSAYDAALAGVEDAKMAIIACNTIDPDALKQAATVANCEAYLNSDAIYSDPTDDTAPAEGVVDGCDTAAAILGRPITDEGTRVTETYRVTGESTDRQAADGETEQAYTCVTIKDHLPDYRSSISFTDTDSTRLVPLMSNSVDSANYFRLSWYSNTDNTKLAFKDINSDGTAPLFHPVSNGYSEPPTLSVTLIQTNTTFSINSSEIDYTITPEAEEPPEGEDPVNNGQTDRGTLILVPTNNSTAGVIRIEDTGVAKVNESGILVERTVKRGFLKANDKTQTNEATLVKCAPDVGDEFVCSVIIQLPKPVGGTRNKDTSLLAVSMLYGQPSTDFSVELCADADCSTIIPFDGAQYAIDSTGRANNVYNRVEHRVEIYDTYFPFPAYALQLNGTDDVLHKVFWAANDGCEYSNNGEGVSPCTNTSGAFSNEDGRILNGNFTAT